jgi:hypothetical protein
VAGTVLHEGHLAGVRLAVFARAQFVEDRAQRTHHVDIGLFVPAADVVGLAQRTRLEHAPDRAAVVGHVQPVAHLLAVAVDRQRLAGQRIVDHQRDQLFREVVGTVVVRAVGGQHRQAVGVVIGTHQVVAGGLAGRVRAVRLVAVGFAEGRRLRRQRAVDFVGRHVQEAEGRRSLSASAAPVGAHGFEQVEGADDIGLDEFSRTFDRAVDVTLGGEVQHRARLVFGQQARHQFGVADVAAHEHMARSPSRLRRFSRLPA